MHSDSVSQFESDNKLKLFLRGDSQSQRLISYVERIRVSSQISLPQKSLAIGFIDRFLTYDHEKRIDVDAAMKSPFLEDHKSSALQSLFSKNSKSTPMRLA